MNVERMNKIEQMKQAGTMKSIEQKLKARSSGIGVLEVCIEAMKEIGDEVRAKEFYSKAVAMGEEIRQLYIQIEAI